MPNARPVHRSVRAGGGLTRDGRLSAAGAGAAPVRARAVPRLVPTGVPAADHAPHDESSDTLDEARGEQCRAESGDDGVGGRGSGVQGRATRRPCVSVHSGKWSPRRGALRPARTVPWCGVPSGAVQSARTRVRLSRPAASGSASSTEPSNSRTTVAVTWWRECRCSRTACCNVSCARVPTTDPRTGATSRIRSRAVSATQASTRSVVRRSGLCRQRQSPPIARTTRTPFPLRDNAPRSRSPTGPGEERATSPAAGSSHEQLTKGTTGKGRTRVPTAARAGCPVREPWRDLRTSRRSRPGHRSGRCRRRGAPGSVRRPACRRACGAGPVCGGAPCRVPRCSGRSW